ncbi:MarR family winged helix-turn-helix transcriptional regulator [Phytomonospora endophytica]|uniref:DNA-binding MarR family transcriptional regulator n=1 Tax=Phytomonospora endophytica TaxID=714109 RepID=A0A841FFH0_9ACTN|nr:MarR family transcriptional regulator [Phytomonospora endophytica]MBB6035016.1 DNA-binding MarR family transcriptional regulator [Phytomonospora endophytica]GIG68270.1 MarR family transcriptional regulator [Phytomonospora endophytica]
MSVEERWLTEAQARAWSQFIRTSQRLEQRLDRDLKSGHDLSHTQYEILVRLADPGTATGNVRMSDLAADLVTAKSAATYQIGQLVERGLVARVKCAEDARTTYVTLTDAGRELLGRAAPDHLGRVRELFLDGLSAAELEMLTDALDRTCARIIAARKRRS